VGKCFAVENHAVVQADSASETECWWRGLKAATRLVFVAMFLRVISTEHAREDHIMTRAKDGRVSRRDKDSNGNMEEVKRSGDESNESARRHTLVVENDAPGGFINLVELSKSAQ